MPADRPTPRAGAARQRILDTAFGLFYAHGPRGVGVDTVIADAHVAKATFYHHFPRKDDLVVAYLDTVDRVWLGQLQAAADAAGDDPRDRLVGMFDALATAARRPGYHGCAFLNTAAESETAGRVHARAVEHKSAVRDWVAGLVERAGLRDPDLVTTQLTVLLDGGLAAGVLGTGQGARAAAAARAAARTLVDAATTTHRPPPTTPVDHGEKHLKRRIRHDQQGRGGVGW